MACHSGRFLLPTCKRKHNSEGLGSSLGFWRAEAAYAIALNLTLAASPMLTGHNIGTSAHYWLALGDGLPCSENELRAAVRAGSLQQIALEDSTQIEDLQSLASGRPRVGSAGAKVLASTAENVLFVLAGCPKLAGGARLNGDLADRVEQRLRTGYHRAKSRRLHMLPWATPAKASSIAAPLPLQVVVHYRAGDLFTVRGEANTQISSLMPHLRDALRIEPVSEKRQRYSFDTLREGPLKMQRRKGA
ncbi:MAG: hypothetical protein SGPRY_004393 [Prymnesium sp.]